MTTERKNVGSGKSRKNFGGSRQDRERETLRKRTEALADFVSAISVTGGVKTDRNGYRVPVCDPEWVDLGEAYVKACDALGVEPKVSDEEDYDD